MSQATFPNDEFQRLNALRSLELLDSEPEPGFDNIALLAADLSGCPIAAISLIDHDRQWFKARVGLGASEAPREGGFCAHTVLQPDVMWIEDAHLDPRFAKSPVVTGAPFVTFYAGAPITVDGHRIGAVFVSDHQPRAFDPQLAQRLQRLADGAANRMVTRREAALLGGIIEYSPTAVVTADIDRRILRWNPAAEMLFGFSANEAIGQSLDLITPEASHSERAGQFEQIVQGARFNMPNGTLEISGRRRDGEIVPLDVSFSVQRTTGQFAVTFLLRDCSERKQREAALSAALVKAEAASRAKSEFLANISHEVCTPLNGVIGLTSALALTPLAADQQETLTTILTSATALNTLLKQIIELAGIEADGLVVEPSAFDITGLCASAGDLFTHAAKSKGISLEVSTDPRCAVGFGDPAHLLQILTILLSNAVKFTHAGRVVVWATRGDGDEVVFVVRDTGVGFAPEEADGLFERFRQGDGRATRAFGGAGLGLAMARELAKGMGGRISASAALGVGATFTLTLPLPLADRPTVNLATRASELLAASKRPADQQQTDAVAQPAPRVLLAEDNPTNRQVVELILSMAGVVVISVENGLKAVEIAQLQSFDAILMDLQMPVMDGLTAIRRIRALEAQGRAPRIPIVVVSANAMDADLVASKDAGADHHIAKPISAELLLGALSAALAPAQQPTAANEEPRAAPRRTRAPNAPA